VVSTGNPDIIILDSDISGIEMPSRLKEAIKQIRIVKEKVDDPEVSGELERALEALENAVESLEDNE